MSSAHGPVVDSRIKTLDAGIPMLYIESEVKVAEHNSSADHSSKSRKIELLT